jgi:hypothetical protein
MAYQTINPATEWVCVRGDIEFRCVLLPEENRAVLRIFEPSVRLPIENIAVFEQRAVVQIKPVLQFRKECGSPP